MESFEEYMHSYRGQLDIEITSFVSLHQGFNLLLSNKYLPGDFSYYDNDNYGELTWKYSEYTSLSNYAAVDLKAFSDFIFKSYTYLQNLERNAKALPQTDQQWYIKYNSYIKKAVSALAIKDKDILPQSDKNKSFFVSAYELCYIADVNHDAPKLEITIERSGDFDITVVSKRSGVKKSKCESLAKKFLAGQDTIELYDMEGRGSKATFSFAYIGNNLSREIIEHEDIQYLSSRILEIYEKTRDFTKLLKSNTRSD